MMDKKDILIIGAGIAGLSAGCFAQANGFSSQILEMHTLPGGLCTAWKRKGYVFDYCIHWLVGSAKGHAFNSLWRSLDMAPAELIKDPEIFSTRINDDGTTIHWYTDSKKLENHLLALATFSEDQALIRKLCAWIRKMGSFVLMEPDFSLRGLLKVLKSLPALGVMAELKGKQWIDFARSFKTPNLREAMVNFFDMEGFPLFAVVFTLGCLHAKNAGYPMGASLPMAQRAEARYLTLGGKLAYGKKVTEIIVEGGKAVGARCADGSEYRADWVISAADVYSTIHRMLGNRFPSPEWDKAFAELKPMPGPIQASYGIRLEGLAGSTPRTLGKLRLDNASATISMRLKTPVKIEDRMIDRVSFHHYAFDAAMGPPHGTPVTFLFNGETAWWQELAKSSDAYKAEKERILDELAHAVDEIVPGFRTAIETRDLATPLTNIRYTDNWQGAQEGFLLTDGDYPLPDTLSGLDHFRLAGQWLHPGGGLPPSALSGRNAIKAICQATNRKFIKEIRVKS